MKSNKQKILEQLDNMDDNFNYELLEKILISKSRLDVKNNSSITQRVKVSKTLGEGQDGFFEISPGGKESWRRYVYRRVTIRIESTDSSVEHDVRVSTGCNFYVINANGFLEYRGEPGDCL